MNPRVEGTPALGPLPGRIPRYMLCLRVAVDARCRRMAPLTRPSASRMRAARRRARRLRAGHLRLGSRSCLGTRRRGGGSVGAFTGRVGALGRGWGGLGCVRRCEGLAPAMGCPSRSGDRRRRGPARRVGRGESLPEHPIDGSAADAHGARDLRAAHAFGVHGLHLLRVD